MQEAAEGGDEPVCQQKDAQANPSRQLANMQHGIYFVTRLSPLVPFEEANVGLWRKHQQESLNPLSLWRAP